MLAEDSEDDFLLIERAFGVCQMPATLKRVVDGHEAMEYFRCQFDDSVSLELIVSDLKMPRMDGLEFLQWLKAEPKFKDIPFIMLSSSNCQNEIETALELGADSYEVKPSTFGELVEIVEKLKARIVECCKH